MNKRTMYKLTFALTVICFIAGAGMTSSNEAAPIAEDCIKYDANTLKIEEKGAEGWMLTDGRSEMQLLDDHKDAEEALVYARRHHFQCFIGRDNHRSDRKNYIMEYWK